MSTAQENLRYKDIIADRKLSDSILYPSCLRNFGPLGKIKLDSLNVQQQQINLYFNADLAQYPLQLNTINELSRTFQLMLKPAYQHLKVKLYSQTIPLEQFLLYYKNNKKKSSRSPVVHNNLLFTSPSNYPQGLGGKQIALWHSHGWYYEASLDRWEWQRARLFGTVEDLSTLNYTLTYLTPMLEKAGARVFIPRERDTQSASVLVDQDWSSNQSKLSIIKGNWTTEVGGYVFSDSLIDFQNPFNAGKYLRTEGAKKDRAALEYLPFFDQAGYYAVYVSWAAAAKATKQAQYTVYHSGGAAQFLLDQNKGAGTWIYLGTFHFQQGQDRLKGSVLLSNADTKKSVLTADAVRFGGGKGLVARKAGAALEEKKWSLAGGKKENDPKESTTNISAGNWKKSNRASYLEGARYYLQAAGIPSSVYSITEGKNDYNDDYQSRGEWVNYLMGQHQEDSTAQLSGLNIGIDLAFAFHTDAGVSAPYTTIGTLVIYNTTKGEKQFPNGQDRLASRDLSEQIQSALVDDIRKLFNPKWTRRALWNKPYSEAWRAKTPTLLLELLSHQNLSDMRYSLDPRFQFTVGRAIYKGMLRYLKADSAVIVSPLAPKQFSIQHIKDKKIRLSWQQQIDPLEPSAEASSYKVYMRIADNGFDEGRTFTRNSIDLDLDDWATVYSFKVSSCNAGGESFSSETLSVCLQSDQQKPILIVNGFDRISGPSWVDSPPVSGVAWWEDQGVPYLQNWAYTGHQYDFNRKSAWLDDDSPGWGASYADHETQALLGNSFDHVYTHGVAIAEAGYSFVSVSRLAFEQNNINPNDYRLLDVLFGEQRSTPSLLDQSKQFAVFNPEMLQQLSKWTVAGQALLLTGAYLGTDMVDQNDTAAINFAQNKLYYKWRTNHADQGGQLRLTDAAKQLGVNFTSDLLYQSSEQPYSSQLYVVEAPDALEPVGNHSQTIYRYAHNNSSAGVVHLGSYRLMVLGFPFESIQNAKTRSQFMQETLKLLLTN